MSSHERLASGVGNEVSNEVVDERAIDATPARGFSSQTGEEAPGERL